MRFKTTRRWQRNEGEVRCGVRRRAKSLAWRLSQCLFSCLLSGLILLGASLLGTLWLPTYAQNTPPPTETVFTIPTWTSQLQLQADGTVKVLHLANLVLPAGQRDMAASSTTPQLRLVLPLPEKAVANNFFVQEERFGEQKDVKFQQTLRQKSVELVIEPPQSHRQYALRLGYQLSSPVATQEQSDLLSLEFLPLNYSRKIGVVSATIQLPADQALAPTDVSHNVLSAGATTYHNFTDNKFLYVGKDVNAKIGFTVQAFLPKGYLAMPARASLSSASATLAPDALLASLNAPLASRSPLSLAILLWFYPLLVIVILLLAWWRHEQVLLPKTRKVPAPGLLAFLAEEKMGGRVLAATLFSLAHQGHLKIASQAQTGIFSSRQSYYFVLLKPASPQLKPHEHLLLHGLFGQSSRLRFLDLAERTQAIWPQFQQMLYEEALAHRYFQRWPVQEKLRYALKSSPLLLPPLIMIVGSLAWTPLADFLLAGWASLALSGALLLLAICFMPAKTAAGLAAYRLALQQAYAQTDQDWLAAWPWLSALGITPRSRPNQSQTGQDQLALPAWYQDARLTEKPALLITCLTELQTLLAGAAPQHQIHSSRYAFSATESAA